MVTAHFPDARLLSFEVLSGGVSANVARLDIALSGGSRRFITLREHRVTHDGHNLDVEFALLSTLNSAGLAVPKPLARDDSQTLLDHPYLLLEFVKGTTHIPADQLGVRIGAMASCMANIHRAPTASLPPLPRIIDPVPELLEVIPDHPEWSKLMQGARALSKTVYDGEPVLLHCDFYPRNILWNEEGVIEAVIDWEDASIGDPLFDVACTCLELRYLYGKPGEQSFREAWERHHTIELMRFALWQAYAAAWGLQNMGNWKLEASTEQAMRQEALDTISEAANIIGC